MGGSSFFERVVGIRAELSRNQLPGFEPCRDGVNDFPKDSTATKNTSFSSSFSCGSLWLFPLALLLSVFKTYQYHIICPYLVVWTY